VDSFILLQEQTRRALEVALEGSTHAILFSGPEGAGKGFAARYFASQKLGLKHPDV
jgi:predicted ATPase with chaperone activity